MTRSNSPYDQVPNWHYEPPAGNDQVGDGQVGRDWRRGTEDGNYFPHCNDARGRDDILTAELQDTDDPTETEKHNSYRAARFLNDGEDAALDTYYRLAQSIQAANPHLITVPLSSPQGQSTPELPPAQPIDQDAFRYEVDGIEHNSLTLHGEAWAEDADDDYEYERGNPNRKFMIAGPLISAIVVGSGLLFGYNALLSTKSNGSAPSAVKADFRPAKVQPVNHEGRNFQYTNGNLMKELGGDHATSRATSANTVGDTTSRVRSVSTFVVDRNGRLIMPGATQRSSMAAAGPSPSTDLPDPISPVPGMIIIGGSPIQPSALGARTIKTSGRTGHERITQPAHSPTTTKIAQ